MGTRQSRTKLDSIVGQGHPFSIPGPERANVDGRFFEAKTQAGSCLAVGGAAVKEEEG